MKAAILSVDTQIYRGFKEDAETAVVKRMLEQVGFTIELEKAIPRDYEVVKAICARIVDTEAADLVITLGGVGCYVDDCTPEAVKSIFDREIPGIADAMRTYMMRTDKRAMLLRGVSGMRKNTLLITLPASPKVIKETLEYTLPEIVHTVEILLGQHERID